MVFMTDPQRRRHFFDIPIYDDFEEGIARLEEEVSTGIRISSMEREQAVVEFVATYGWALLIVIVMAGVLGYYIMLPQNATPDSCTFFSGAICNDFVIATNTTTHNTLMYLNISNFGSYPILNPKLTINLGGTNSTQAFCYPDYVLPGGTLFCTVKLSIQTNFYQFMNGTLYLNVSDCGLESNYTLGSSCQSPPARIYMGTFVGHSEPETHFQTSYIYCVGTEGQAPYNQSYFAPVYSNGGVGNWSQTSNYPIALSDAGCSMWKNYIYCAGGNEGGNPGSQPATTNAYYAPVLAGQGIGKWNQTTSYPLTLNNSGCSAYNNYLYCVGTNSTYPYNYTFYAHITPHGIGQWIATTPYPAPIAGVSCSIYNGRIYCVGRSLGGNPKGVYYANVSQQGIGNWTQTIDYPTAFSNAGCLTFQGYIYCMGTNQNRQSYYAQLLANGPITGGWIATTPYPVKLYYAGCSIFDNYLYCIGDFFDQNQRESVYYAPISTQGIGGWNQTTPYPIPFYNAYCAVYGSSGGYYG